MRTSPVLAALGLVLPLLAGCNASGGSPEPGR